MKEHSLFLLAGFPAKETGFIQRADQFREEFEDGLRKTVNLANGIVSESILNSGEVVTEFTRKAECQTRNLTGIPIDEKITEVEEQLHAGNRVMINRETVYHVRMLNQQIISETEKGGRISAPDLKNLEIFWNQIMMEHAQKGRGSYGIM